MELVYIHSSFCAAAWPKWSEEFSFRFLVFIVWHRIRFSIELKWNETKLPPLSLSLREMNRFDFQPTLSAGIIMADGVM